MSRLGELLVQRGLLTAEQVNSGLERAVHNQTRLGTALVQLELVSLDDVAQSLAQQHDKSHHSQQANHRARQRYCRCARAGRRRRAGEAGVGRQVHEDRFLG